MSTSGHLFTFLLLVGLAACDSAPETTSTSTAVPAGVTPGGDATQPAANKIVKSEAEWRAQLSPEEFRIARESGTERAFTGRYWDTKTAGTYLCVCCDTPLFSSETKFKSGTGWPSFWQPIDAESVDEHRDVSFGSVRTEVRCSRCDAHLGHVFPDGPKPTGLRYCLNSAALQLDEADAD